MEATNARALIQKQDLIEKVRVQLHFGISPRVQLRLRRQGLFFTFGGGGMP